MAYNDTKNFSEAVEKARELGATHYYQHALETGCIFSTTFVKSDLPDDNNNLTEVGHYINSMASFSELERLIPFSCIGVKIYSNNYSLTGEARYEGCFTKLIKIAPVYKLPPFNDCK